MINRVVVIGSGFAGLSAACCLAALGAEVTVLEKNSTPGGRARLFLAEGFRFDMGPSWYWMPDVFEQFFARFGKKPSDYYDLVRLDPSYQILYGPEDKMQVPATPKEILLLFESIESGSSEKLIKFLSHAEYKYRVGMQEFVFKPAHTLFEFMDPRILKAGFRLQLLRSLSAEVRSNFKDPRLIRMLEFPVLFLGATPEKTPAMYSMMNYADIVLGTWYPKGGMIKIVDAMVALAEESGVTFRYNTEVTHMETDGKKIKRLQTTAGEVTQFDTVIAAGDYHHIEQLLEKKNRQYDEAYWQSRVMAPSSLIFYLGLKGRLKNVLHHNLFFDREFAQHGEEIYTNPKWPTDPLFYMCVPSVTDPEVAPEGCENVFLLMPLAPGIEDREDLREKYFDIMVNRIQAITGNDIKNQIVYKRSYCINDFIADYHSFRGNAYGLANTLNQTAFLKPKMKSRKIDNLFFTGQLTVPGPGIPPAIISGQIAASEVMKQYA